MRVVLGLCAAASLLAVTVAAQDRRVARADAPGERRIALVIGNQAYPAMPLKNAAQDARDIHGALTDAGFDSDLLVNATQRQLQAGIQRFIDRLGANDVAFVYYAGHGVQIAGENYLMPVDVDTRDEPSVRYSSYSAALLHDRMTDKGARLKILVLDACRNNPFRMSRSAAPGLAAMAAPGRGSFIAFATGPGSTADDNVLGSNGLFTGALLENLRKPGLDLGHVFDLTRQRVDELSGGRQTPWSNSSVVGRFVFRGASVPPSGTRPTVIPDPARISTPIDIDRAPTTGSPSAPVTLVEIADFHCPFCRRHSQQVQPLIDAEFVRTGKVRRVFIHFPMEVPHPAAFASHEASACASEQDRFWEAHSKLFETPARTAEELTLVMRNAGLDVNAFQSCMNAGRHKQLVRDSVTLMESLGVSATPMFLIGFTPAAGEKFTARSHVFGAQPFPVFKKALDTVLTSR